MSNDLGTPHPLPTTLVGGISTVALTRRELADVMVADCFQARQLGSKWLPRLVFSSNGQGIALAGRDTGFARAMGEADLVHADGMPVVFASRMTSTPLPERICTTDFFHDAAQAAAANGLKFYFLGARSEQNEAATAAVAQLYPEVQIVGGHHGYFGDDDDERICELVRESGADVLWVALGRPRQEHWCVRNRTRLSGIGWVKTCGGMFSYLAGDAPRSPHWMQMAGLEWLHRTLDDPKRLAWRYVTTNPYALYRLVRHTERRARR